MQPKSKPFWQSKTNWANAFTVIIAMCLFAAGQDYVHPDIVKGLLFVVGILNIFLRFLTDKPITIPGMDDGPKPGKPTP